MRPWKLGLGALGSTCMLGAASLGMTLDAIWSPWPHRSAGLTAMWLRSRTLGVEQGAASVSLVSGLASACLGILPYGGRVVPAVCGQLAAGVLHGEGEHIVQARSAFRPYLAAGDQDASM